MPEATKITKYRLGGPISVEKLTNQSAANTALTLATPTGKRRRVLYATVKYSATPVQTGVTFEIDNGVGVAFDAVLSTGAANARTTTFFPSSRLELPDDDTLKVIAPAAGGAITSAISIVTEV